MSHGTLAALANLCAATQPPVDVDWTGVSTDTRTLEPGQLFVGLNGPNHRGADFVAAARERGATAAVLDRPVDDPLPQLVVDDTLTALGRIACDWRSRFDLPLVGLTGSNGKTTVKQMLASCLGDTALATEGNLNNAIGVPLTLLRLHPDHRFAVIEMGANHAGEIAY
ncbi:MAG: Mur ligase family protein, partial [Pseudomonadota bacterium]